MDLKWKDMIVLRLMNYLQNDLMCKSVIINASMIAFMEKLLEKLNPEEVLSKTFNFDNKERYLASLAYLLFSKKTYSISKDEFLTFTKDYHLKK